MLDFQNVFYLFVIFNKFYMAYCQDRNIKKNIIQSISQNQLPNFFISLEACKQKNINKEQQQSSNGRQNQIDMGVNSEEMKYEYKSQFFLTESSPWDNKQQRQIKQYDNLESTSIQFAKIIRLKQKNINRQKIKSRSNFFQSSQNLSQPIFSKSSALKKFISKNIIMPDAQCLGCVRFFYKEISYDFKACQQKKYVLDTKTAHQESRLLTYLHQLYNSKKQGYIFVTEVTLTDSGSKILGFNRQFDVFNFISFFKKVIRQFTFQIGQRYITVKNYQISLIPVIQGEIIQDLGQLNLRKRYIKDFALRIKFIPFNKQFFQSSRSKNKIRDATKRSHWPIECEHPLQFSSYSNFQAMQKYNIFPTLMSYSKITLIKQNDSKKLAKRKQLIKNIQKIAINQCFLNICNSAISEDIKSRWIVLQHNCPHSLIQKLVRKIFSDDIFQTKASKYLIVYDESFYLSDTYCRFMRVFESVTDAEYVVFNIKEGLKLCKRIRSPTYYIFEDLSSALLAFFLFQEFNIGRAQFISRSQMLSQIHTDSENIHHSMGKVK